MLYRKIETFVESHLMSNSDKILVLEGARQIGKSYIIRAVGSRLYPNFIEINLTRDAEGDKLFKEIKSVEEFYLLLSSIYKGKIGNYEDTLIFLDEVQQYPQYLTWLKFFREDRRFRFIASGSLLGISFRHTTSIPIGSIIRKEMYQLDFEEFLIANGFGDEALDYLKEQFKKNEPLTPAMHTRVMDLFLRYLLVGGMPDAVNAYLSTHNIAEVRQVQSDIHTMYQDDAVKYENDFERKLLVKRIYDMIPSQMENKKKRIVAKDIRDKKGDRFEGYRDEFEYLISSGIALGTNAITNPKYPLTESMQKNLLKLYLNDVGLLTNILYKLNIKPILDNTDSINLGAVYENVVAQELKAHGHRLFYYDRKNVGEVDFMVDDYYTLSPLPIEVKSGKDYYVHSALNRLLNVEDYGINRAIVLHNQREVIKKENITYMPVYYVMFIDSTGADNQSLIF